MKREIKFRCWFPAGTDTGDGEIEKGQMCYELAFEDYEPVNDLLRGVDHLMQFTGLKDAGGQDIYECDLCLVNGKDLTQCVYDKWGKPCLLGVHRIEGYDFGELENRGIFANKHGAVVGNVYENPELLAPGRKWGNAGAK